jgi:hypothetical protein
MTPFVFAGRAVTLFFCAGGLGASVIGAGVVTRASFAGKGSDLGAGGEEHPATIRVTRAKKAVREGLSVNRSSNALPPF